MISSPEIIEEVENKPNYKFQVPNEKVETFIGILLHFFVIVEPRERADVVKDDVSDNKVLECALEG